MRAMSDANTASMGQRLWTPTLEQDEVIRRPAEARILVDAGPGTGKTALSCLRIAWLVDCAELHPTDIWLVSFTRTAVHELRSRIESYLADSEAASGLRISTIDSLVWALRSGFDPSASLAGGYEAGIQSLTDMLVNDERVGDYLAQLRHLIVDEAQDIVGSRTQLLLEIVNALPASCGVTVLADEAQAIFGFTQQQHDVESVGYTFPGALREYMSQEFVERDLVEVHRTQEPVLTELLTTGRADVRSRQTPARQRHASVRKLIMEKNHGDLGGPWPLLKNEASNLDGVLILFRTRGQVIKCAGLLNEEPRRLRVPGLPAAVHSWVADIFWDWCEDEIDGTEFRRRWSDRVAGALGGSLDAAWATLIRLVGLTPNRISVGRLARLVARRSPPIELCGPDFGHAGPIFSTIHASKGREADVVYLWLPSGYGEDDDDRYDDEVVEEEARVLFVGASRARSVLRVGQIPLSYSFSSVLPTSGRAFKVDKGKSRMWVEFGIQGDLSARTMVGRDLFLESADAHQAQLLLRASADSVTSFQALRSGEDKGWSYELKDAKTNGTVGFLEGRVNSDLFEVLRFAKGSGRATPYRFSYLRSLGTTTIALAPEDPLRQALHTPWRDSGFIHAPLLTGNGLGSFSGRKS